MVLKSKCKRALDKTRKLWEDAKKSGDSTIVDIHERISSEIKESEVVHGLYQEIKSTERRINSMTDEEIVKRAKDAEKRTSFGELVHSPISKGVNSAYGIGFIEGMVEYRNSLQEEPVSEDLEEKARQLGKKYFPDEENIWARANFEAKKVESACIEMANWQKEKDLKLKLPTEISVIVERIAHDSGKTFDQGFAVLNAAFRAYKKGKSDMKQQMMKGSLDGTAQTYLAFDSVRFCDKPLHKRGIKTNNPVKVIIIKDE